MSMNYVSPDKLPEELGKLMAEQFEFANTGEKIMDEELKTVSRGFFKDALFRLKRNKAAIAAFWIICLMVVMAIFGPNMNKFTFSEQHPDFTNMPPRIPVLEDMGIFNGERVLTNRRLDSLENPEKFPAGSVLGYSNPHEVRGVTLVDVEVNYYKYIGADDTYFWFGTDNMGRDVWTRLWRGARVSLIIAVDFKSVIPDFFTPKWYPSQSMKQITVTFDEYIGDYKTVLHSSFMEVFIEEMSDALLVAYLESVRNKGAKIRRMDPFNDKVYSDVALVFEFIFSTQSSQFTKDLLKGKWRATDYFCRLIGCDKSSVVAVYEQFRAEFWDLQLSWVEAVLRTRDDFERSMVNSVKTRAATLEVIGGDETIMSRVK